MSEASRQRRSGGEGRGSGVMARKRSGEEGTGESSGTAAAPEHGQQPEKEPEFQTLDAE